jgi:hypothetical protein
MKPKSIPGNTTAKRGASADAIRVVPLYHPKPVLSIDELAAQKKPMAKGAGRRVKPPQRALPHLVYNGGALLTNVAVFTVFWGSSWGANPASLQMVSDLNKFFTTILTSPLMSQLAEYNVPGQAIGPGTLAGSATITANAPVGSVTDAAIQTELANWIKTKAVAPGDKNTLYFIYLDPNVVAIMGGSRSCQSFCGYHNTTANVFYAVMPFPTCPGCLGGLKTFDALTGTSSHELCEAITDPIPGAGWYDNVNGEIGDICAWKFKQLQGYTVQLEWSNQQGKCV